MAGIKRLAYLKNLFDNRALHRGGIYIWCGFDVVALGVIWRVVLIPMLFLR